MKSLINLSTCLLDDLGRLCSVDTARDLDYIKSRAQHEGISFFTITLPEFASDFERCLEANQVTPTAFVGWRKTGCLPSFLRGFTELVFDREGRIRQDGEIHQAVYAVRQITRFAKKVQLPCSDKRTKAAFSKFADLEDSLQWTTVPHNSARMRHFYDLCDTLWGTVFARGFNSLESVPKHGPGATAEMISGNQKYRFVEWSTRLERVFPFTHFGMPSISSIGDSDCPLNVVKYVKSSDEKPVRVISVPKTLKTPRIIAIEPVCMQYTQQAIMSFLVETLESHEFTKRSIRFTDQSVNQKMALHSSASKEYSTLDLSDASDRVTAKGVAIMLRSAPDLRRAVFATRSKVADVPGIGLIRLKKFASMGSALCFPIESMYFFSVILHSLLWKHNLPPSRSAILKWAPRVDIYGDDIIVPVDETDTVIEALHSYGCKVNVSKSFTRGNFRESCGTDAYCGVDVTPIYLRNMRPSTRRDFAGVLSWIATSNLFHKGGCWRTAHYMRLHVERLLGKLPVVLDKSPGLGWSSFLGLPPASVYSVHTHAPIVHTYVCAVRKEEDELDGYPALLKYFLVSNRVERPVTDKEHLAKTARFGTVSKKRRWVPAA